MLQCPFSAKTAAAAAMPTAMQAQYTVHATARGIYKQSKGSMQAACSTPEYNSMNFVPNAHSDRSGINYHATNQYQA